MSNASLRLGKYARLPHHTGYAAGTKWGTYAAEQFAGAEACRPDPHQYRAAYDRWKKALTALPGAKLAGRFEVEGRMIVGIGQENVLENSIALHRLWGIPYIPGSALKGLAHHYASWLAAQPNAPFDAAAVDALFGTTGDGGLVTFHDAWYIPNDRDPSGLQIDVITGHHGDWYAGKIVTRPESWYTERGKAVPPEMDRTFAVPPWDFTDPVPVTLLSARGAYLVVVQEDPGIERDRGAWAKAAMEIVTEALKDWGVGAKTNAGYGRLQHNAKNVIRMRSAQDKADEHLAQVRTEVERARQVERAAVLEGRLAVLEAEILDADVDTTSTTTVIEWLELVPMLPTPQEVCDLAEYVSDWLEGSPALRQSVMEHERYAALKAALDEQAPGWDA